MTQKVGFECRVQIKLYSSLAKMVTFLYEVKHRNVNTRQKNNSDLRTIILCRFLHSNIQMGTDNWIDKLFVFSGFSSHSRFLHLMQTISVKMLQIFTNTGQPWSLSSEGSSVKLSLHVSVLITQVCCDLGCNPITCTCDKDS